VPYWHVKGEFVVPEISLRHQIHKTLSWLLIFPLLAIWPFISAFPLFGILEATRFDLKTFTNCLFALTGFWAVLGLSITAWFIMGDQARTEARFLLQKRALLIGGYVFVWSTLYMLFAIFKN
jgi:hypothetical protein